MIIVKKLAILNILLTTNSTKGLTLCYNLYTE